MFDPFLFAPLVAKDESHAFLDLPCHRRQVGAVTSAHYDLLVILGQSDCESSPYVSTLLIVVAD